MFIFFLVWAHWTSFTAPFCFIEIPASYYESNRLLIYVLGYITFVSKIFQLNYRISRARTHAVLVIGLYELLDNPTT
jgi:hypothetical protein